MPDELRLFVKCFKMLRFYSKMDFRHFLSRFVRLVPCCLGNLTFYIR